MVGIAVGHVHWGERRGVVSCWVSWWRGEGAWWNNVAIKTWCKFGGLCPSAPTTSAPRAGGGELLGVEMGVPQVCKAFGSKQRHLWVPKELVALHHSFVPHVVKVAPPSTRTLVRMCM